MNSARVVKVGIHTLIVFILVCGAIFVSTNNSIAVAQKPVLSSNISTFHAIGTIASLVSHLLAPADTSSLSVANSTNLLRSTYLPGHINKSISAASMNAPVTTGPISKSLFARSLTNPNILLPKIYVTAGNWTLDVISGKVQKFIANFTEVLTTGNNPHIHTITHFKTVSTNAPISLTPEKSANFSGTADIMRNGKVIWSNVPIKVFIAKGYVISISIDPEKSGNHFRGVPIFGTVTSLASQNSKELRPSILATSGNNTM
jgi:hypothetical protein